jgi:ubiquinone/menaquinone biosynthesis C-methylase UbiE
MSHPILSRINSWFFQAMDGYAHWKLGAAKSALFSTLPPTVVELGSGTGANLRYLDRGTRLIAVEPNPHMHAPLLRRARARGIDVEISSVTGEAVDLPDASADAVISTLVLCSVHDVTATLRQVLRILRPGGRFMCIEHVAAPADSFVGRVQRWLRRPWEWFFEGCHTHRDLEQAILEAGFTKVRIERVTMDTMFVPIRPQIRVVAVR